MISQWISLLIVGATLLVVLLSEVYRRRQGRLEVLTLEEKLERLNRELRTSNRKVQALETELSEKRVVHRKCAELFGHDVIDSVGQSKPLTLRQATGLVSKLTAHGMSCLEEKQDARSPDVD